MFANPSPWEVDEILRINCLSDKDLISEVHSTMNGLDYSWATINKSLKELRDLDYALYLEWNFLCGKKREWEPRAQFLRKSPTCGFGAPTVLSHMSRIGQWDSLFYRHLLINLKILPVHAGLGDEGIVYALDVV